MAVLRFSADRQHQLEIASTYERNKTKANKKIAIFRQSNIRTLRKIYRCVGENMTNTAITKTTLYRTNWQDSWSERWERVTSSLLGDREHNSLHAPPDTHVLCATCHDSVDRSWRTRPWIHKGTRVCKALFQGVASPCSRWPIASFT